MLIDTPISLGELVDKISILMIKKKNIKDEEKLIHVKYIIRDKNKLMTLRDS